MGKRGPKPSTSTGLKERLGNVEITKGSTPDGIPVVMWDAIPECEGNRCQIVSSCPYDHVGKCRVRRDYLDYVYRHFIGSVDGENAMALFRIGMHVIPLFGHLVTLKIANHGRGAVYYTDKGDLKVNPLFREIRETIRCINQNIETLLPTLGKDFGKGGEGDDLLGDTGYYDELFKGDSPQVERKRRNRI